MYSSPQETDEQNTLDTEIQTEQPPARKRQIVTTIICVLIVALLAVTCALLVKTYVISTFKVDGISMFPTLDGGSGSLSDADPTNGETLYLNRLAKIKRGDIVVFTPEWDSMRLADGSYKSLVKRVIAVEGDHLQIIDGKVWLNGELLDEPYINGVMSHDHDGLDVTVSAGHVFCMGDNRNHSSDCRDHGEVPVSSVVGKCFLIKSISGKLRKP